VTVTDGVASVGLYSLTTEVVLETPPTTIQGIMTLFIGFIERSGIPFIDVGVALYRHSVCERWGSAAIRCHRDQPTHY